MDGPMTPEAAAEYLSITRGSLYNLVHLKKITCYKPSGKMLYFRKADLDAYITRGQVLADFEVARNAERTLIQGAHRFDQGGQ